MNHKISQYIVALAIMFIFPFIIIIFLPNEFWKGIAATPAIGALFSALFLLFRDHAAYEKQLELQRKEHILNLGATSHMANPAF